MATSFSELKSLLNIKTVSHKWNEAFKKEEILNTYSNTDIKNEINDFCEYLTEGHINHFINKIGIFELGSIAEIFGLIFAYFVTDIDTIQIFFYKKIDIVDWFEMFKQHVNRKQFFSLIKSYKALPKYTSMFDLSTYYQLTPPNKPLYCLKPFISKFNDEYILIQYNNEIKAPTYKIVKPGIRFKEFNPKITINENDFNTLTFEFDNKTFKGGCIKDLSIDTKQQKEQSNIIIQSENKTYELDSQNGILYCTNNSKSCKEIYDLEKFKKDPNVKIIFDKEINNSRCILLSNGFIWNVNNLTFTNIKSLKNFDTLNLELFSMSTSEGIIISLNDHDIEYVPTFIFEKYLSKFIK